MGSISCKWPRPHHILSVLLILEFACLTTLLGLFGYANPDTYRTALLNDGISSGFVNYTSETPLVWKPVATTSCLYLALLSVLMLVVQAVLFILSLLPPVLSLVVHIIMVGVWAAIGAVYQIGTQGVVPWYLVHSCDKVSYSKNWSSCMQAKGALAVSVLLVVVYLAVVVWSIVAIVGGVRRARREEVGKGKEHQHQQQQQQEEEEEMKAYLPHAV